jgi:hypothetical protein
LSAGKDLHTEAHISEILDSDNESQHEISSEEEKPPKNIWSNAEFWGNPSRKLILNPKAEEQKQKPVLNA